MNIYIRNTPRQYLRNGDLNVFGDVVAGYYNYGISGTGSYLPALPFEDGGYLVEDLVTFSLNIIANALELKTDLTVNNKLNVYGDTNLKNTTIDGDINITGKILVNGEEFKGGDNGESYLKDLKDINYNWENLTINGLLKYTRNGWEYQSLPDHKKEIGISVIESSISDLYQKVRGSKYYYFDRRTSHLEDDGNPWDDYQDFIEITLRFPSDSPNSFRIVLAFRLYIEVVDDWGTSIILFNALPDWGGDGTASFGTKFSIIGIGPHTDLYFFTRSSLSISDVNRVLIPICSDWYHTAKHVKVKARCSDTLFDYGDGESGEEELKNYVTNIGLVSGYFYNGSGRFCNPDGTPYYTDTDEWDKYSTTTYTYKYLTREEAYTKNEVYAKSEVYNKEEVNLLINNIDVTDIVYTKEEVYSKEETDNKINITNNELLLNINAWMVPINNRLTNVEGLLEDIELALEGILGYETTTYLEETLDEILYQ